MGRTDFAPGSTGARGAGAFAITGLHSRLNALAARSTPVIVWACHIDRISGTS
jgi:hypothetical protein